MAGIGIRVGQVLLQLRDARVDAALAAPELAQQAVSVDRMMTLAFGGQA